MRWDVDHKASTNCRVESKARHILSFRGLKFMYTPGALRGTDISLHVKLHKKTNGVAIAKT